MRKIFLIIAPLILTNCTYEKVLLNDVDKLVSNQMENNRVEIDRIKREIKGLGIEKLGKNVSLMNRLDTLHENVVRLNNIVDTVDQDVALRLVMAFREQYFNDLDFFSEVPLELNSATPNPLFKLHIATLEAFLVMQKRGQYDFEPGDLIGFDSLAMQINTDKTIISKGEKLSGQLILVGASTFKTSKHIIKRMTLNGQEISASKYGWKFEIRPSMAGTGLVEYELKCEAVVNDTTLVGRRTIYIRN